MKIYAKVLCKGCATTMNVTKNVIRVQLFFLRTRDRGHAALKQSHANGLKRIALGKFPFRDNHTLRCWVGLTGGHL